MLLYRKIFKIVYKLIGCETFGSVFRIGVQLEAELESNGFEIIIFLNIHEILKTNKI